ncbi:MAG TPA: sialidase family protein [Acidimicrobiales bacterium]|nr:sialidase family protein [Acidimicrobiales bacterium]
MMQPAGASFLSPTEGYLLEDLACHGRAAGASPCLAMAFTNDAGGSWRPLAAPPVAFFWGLGPGSGQVRTSVSQVDFANTNDGYLFNPGLEVTHNGSRTWLDAKLRDVSDLVTTRDYAFALTAQPTANGAVPQELWRSRLGSARWTRVPVPSSGLRTELVADVGEVLLLGLPAPYGAVTSRDAPGRIWVGGNPGQPWRVAGSPCLPRENGAAAALAVSYGRPADWALDCMLDDQSSQAMYVEHSIFVSTDSGKHWRLAGHPLHRGSDAALAWNGGTDFLLATESASDQLNASTDGGHTWSTPISDGGDFYGWANLGFVGQHTAVVVGPTHYGYPGHPARLDRSEDGGATWSALRLFGTSVR